MKEINEYEQDIPYALPTKPKTTPLIARLFSRSLTHGSMDIVNSTGNSKAMLKTALKVLRKKDICKDHTGNDLHVVRLTFFFRRCCSVNQTMILHSPTIIRQSTDNQTQS